MVRDDVGITIHLVAAHKEVAVGVPDSEDKLGPDRCQETRTIYGRKVDPDFDEPGPIKKGALAHGFSVGGSGVGLIDRFRDDVHARMSEEDDMPDEQTFKKWVGEVVDEELDRRLEGGVVPGQQNIGGTLAVIADRTQKALDAIREQPH